MDVCRLKEKCKNDISHEHIQGDVRMSMSDKEDSC